MAESQPFAPSPLLTLPEVAEHFQVSRRTVERLIRRADLPALKVGRSTRVDPVELERWLHGETPSAETP